MLLFIRQIYKKEQLSAIAFTQGPGRLGSFGGKFFCKIVALALQIPLIAVNHMQVCLAHFIEEVLTNLPFPLALTISGGHTQIIKVDDFFLT
jgi:N6-L-threonylcarbamoyladenine synthase